MKGFTRKQQQFLDSLEVRRAREVDIGKLRAMTGPVINGYEQRNIIDCFLRDLPEDRNGHLASFVVMASSDLPLVFFQRRGALVRYYQSYLKFSVEVQLAVKKPYFDWACQFLCQDIDDLLNNRTFFFRNVNRKETC